MNLNAWNEAFFQRLVKDVGSAGDPLYFYVDDEVLAEISGHPDPEVALEDFVEAFRTTSFDESIRRAFKWKSGGYTGTPFFLSAMAITVLAVTLEPLGANANNVYRRQHRLLSTRGPQNGMPADYDRMHLIWTIWNGWLEQGEGRQYGLPTAHEHSRYKHQGYARSQAFLRHRDKQDIYSFFKAEGSRVPDGARGEDLVDLLLDWLGRRGSASRLARSCEDEGLRGELGNALTAAWTFWTGEEEARQGPATFAAVPLWDPDGDTVHLVVPLAHAKGAVGARLVDLNQEPWDVDEPLQYFHLTDQYTDPESWLAEPVENWKLNETWSTTWAPPDDGVFYFVPDEDGWRWVGTDSTSLASDYRVLLGPTGVRKMKALVERAGAEFSSVAGPSDGYRWLSLEGDERISGSELARLLGKAPAQRVNRNHHLHGGLKLSGNAYLNGFEPDVVIPNDTLRTALAAGTEPVVSVDGTICKSDLDPDTGTLFVSLSKETLEPGDHRITVQIGESTHHSNVRSTPPDAPALPQAQRRRHRRDHIVRFSLDRADDPMVLMIDAKHQVFEITPSTEVRYWLRILRDEDEDVAAFERHFDSSWLDWIHPIPGETAMSLVFALRESADKPWRILRREGGQGGLNESSRFESVREADAWTLMQLLGDGAKHFFVGEDDREFMRETRRVRSRELSELQGRLVHKNKKWGLRGNRPLSAKKTRADVTVDLLDNPYEDLLLWLSEKGEAGVLSATAESAFAWLCRRAGFPEVLDFQKTVRDLEALGHITRAGGKIAVRPASLTWLPDSEALASIGGARGQETVTTLLYGDGAPTEEQNAALQDITAHAFTQYRKHPTDPSRAIPTAPQTVYVQLGSLSQTVSQQAQELGFEFFDPSIRELESFPSLHDLLLDSANRISTAELKGRTDQFLPSNSGAGGRWRAFAMPLTALNEDAFLRIQTSIGRKYAWWSHTEQRLVNCGWVNGLWGFHRNTATQDLFGVNAEKDRFAVWDPMPLSPRIEEFLVMRTGLLPRVAVELDGANHWRGKPRRWRVYGNVPPSVAAIVSGKLGHTWSRARSSRPTDLKPSDDTGRLEFL